MPDYNNISNYSTIREGPKSNGCWSGNEPFNYEQNQYNETDEGMICTHSVTKWVASLDQRVAGSQAATSHFDAENVAHDTKNVGILIVMIVIIYLILVVLVLIGLFVKECSYYVQPDLEMESLGIDYGFGAFHDRPFCPFKLSIHFHNVTHMNSSFSETN